MNASKDHQVGVPRYAENAVVRAILIGQPQLRAQAIASVRNLDPEIEESVEWDPRYHMTRLFVALATDAGDEVPEIADRLRETADDLDDSDAEWRAYFRQLATVAEAIVAAESTRIETELDQLLTLHDDVAREKKDRTDVMDHRSGALVVLARERGLPVDPDDNEYLPTDLIELVEPL